MSLQVFWRSIQFEFVKVWGQNRLQHVNWVYPKFNTWLNSAYETPNLTMKQFATLWLICSSIVHFFTWKLFHQYWVYSVPVLYNELQGFGPIQVLQWEVSPTMLNSITKSSSIWSRNCFQWVSSDVIVCHIIQQQLQIHKDVMGRWSYSEIMWKLC